MKKENVVSIRKSTIDNPRQDPATVNSKGEPLTQLPHGVTTRDIKTHCDDRGMVFELYDKRWGWHPDPVIFIYSYTIRPGYVKGWGLHKLHEDRYVIMQGEMEIVFYDPRPDSPTYGQVSKTTLTEYNRRMLNIPVGVWHANRNIGTKDVMVVNMPTTPYDHENPDKYFLPLDTDQIPYKFPKTVRGIFSE